MIDFRGLLLAGLVFLAGESASLAGGLPHAAPEAVGMDGRRLAEIDRVVDEALREKRMPGCVVCIGRQGKIVWLRAYGNKQVEPEPLPMTADTVFDLASLTKPIATATSVMVLLDREQVRLEDRVAAHLPEFGQHGKEDVTVLHLLTHQGGLIADNALRDYRDGPERAWERIFALRLTSEPGTKFVYSDVGFLVLGALVQRVSGQDVNSFSRQHIFEPLGMRETGFLPSEPLRARAAPTEQRDGRWIQGEVHDPRAYHLGGVAGHAGLFSTAADLASYAQMMVNRGQGAQRRILSEAAWRVMTQPYPVSRGRRAAGWDMRTGYSTNRGATFSDAAFGHGGFTGTALWIDPQLELFVIFLSNRLHPDGQGAVNPLAGRIGTIAAEAIQ